MLILVAGICGLDTVEAAKTGAIDIVADEVVAVGTFEGPDWESRLEFWEEDARKVRLRQPEADPLLDASPVPLLVPDGVPRKLPEHAGDIVSYDPATGEETVRPIPLSLPGAGTMEPGSHDGASGSGLAASTRAFGPLTQIFDTSAYPWGAVANLAVSFGQCSATLIDPFHVLTAGHCVHQGPGGDWAAFATINPGYASGERPFGLSNARTFHATSLWINSGLFEYDLGVITLERPIMPAGWLGFGYSPLDSFYSLTTFHSSGYPGEDPYNGDIQYYWFGTNDLVLPEVVRMNNRSYGGQSGSSMYVLANESSRVVHSVLSAGNDVIPYTQNVRMTQAKFNAVRDILVANRPGAADIIPGYVAATPDMPQAGAQFSSFEYWLLNYSAASFSGNVTVSTYLSADDVIDPAVDFLLDTRIVTLGLEPLGRAHIISPNPPVIPVNAPGGTAWIGLVVDLADANAGNNAASGQDAAAVTISTNIPTPTNDNFVDAQTLPIFGSFTRLANTTQATAEIGEPTYFPLPTPGDEPSRTVWYRLSTPIDCTIDIDTFGSDYDTVLAIYLGDSLTTLQRVAVSDDSGVVGNELQSRLQGGITAGDVYSIVVGAKGLLGGNAVLNVTLTYPPPPNDDFVNAAPLIHIPGLEVGVASESAWGATAEAGEPMHGGRAAERSVWYTLTPPRRMTLGLDTYLSDYDTVIAVYRGSALDMLTLVAASDDAGGTLQSEIEGLVLEEGVPYAIAVDGYAGEGGYMIMNWRTGPAPATLIPSGLLLLGD